MSDGATMTAYAFHDATLPVEREPLSPLTRRCMLVGIVALHVAGGWALITMQTPKLIIGEVAPMEVRMVQAEQPPAPAEAQLQPPEEMETPVIDPPPPETPPPEVELAIEPPPPDLPPPQFPVDVKPTPPPPPPKPKQAVKQAPRPVPKPAAPAAEVAPTAPATAPAASTAPRTVAASQVQYIDPPSPSYPVRSRRAGETGQAMVRVLIDTGGRATQVGLQKSTGHQALDDEALSAVRKARFRPYVEGGVAQPVWVLIPINFVLQ